MSDHAKTRGWFTKADVLEHLAKIDRVIETTELARGAGDDSDRQLNDAFRRGKLEALRYIRAQFVSQADWKGMELP